MDDRGRSRHQDRGRGARVVNGALRIAVADDNILLRAGIVRILEGEGWAVTAEVGTADDLLAAVRRDVPDVAIVDIRMPPGHADEGIRATHQIRAEFGERVAVLVVSQYLEPDFAMRLLGEGDRGVGYLLKDRVADVKTFTDAVRRVVSGGQVIDSAIVTLLLNRRRRQDPLDALTEREREVLALMAEGRSNQSIAETLFLAPKTVEAYISSIFAKLALEPAATDHRRVLAVLAYLQAR
jgi:DNA-binding NarL/FixJ family response regulator